MRKHGPTS